MKTASKSLVYKTTNLLNKKFYIGVHRTDTPYEFDGYYGSSEHLTNSRKKYGDENFIREILFIFDTEEEAYVKEKELVDTEFVSRKDTYNIKTGGLGGCSHTEESKKLMSRAKRNSNNGMCGKFGEENPMFGKQYTKEDRVKLSIAHLGEEVYYQRLKDIADIEKVWGWKSKLAEKWCVAQNTASCFIKTHYICFIKNKDILNILVSGGFKVKMSITTLGKDVYYHRLKDIKDIDKKHGWRTKLAKKWGIAPNTASVFIKKHYIDEGYTQRFKDITEIKKVYGWKVELARKWGVDPSAVRSFLHNHKERLDDIPF